MKKEYDFSKAKVHKGPIADPKKTKVQTSLRIDADVMSWAQTQAKVHNIPYQTFLNKTLRDSMQRPSIEDRLAAVEKKVFKKKHG